MNAEMMLKILNYFVEFSKTFFVFMTTFFSCCKILGLGVAKSKNCCSTLVGKICEKIKFTYKNTNEIVTVVYDKMNFIKN